MSYLSNVIRGTPCMVDTLAPTVPVTSLPGPAGDLVADTSARLLEISDRLLDLSDFGATGTGTTDDTEAFIDALDYVKFNGRMGRIFVPPGTVKVTATLGLDTDYMQVVGSGDGRSIVDYRGSGDAFLITAAQHVLLKDLKVRTESALANGTTHGIRCAYEAATTSYMHTIDRVHVVGFTEGAGFKFQNNELTVVSQSEAFGCKYGAVWDNKLHSASALGINNAMRHFRAQNSLDNGIDLTAQASFSLDGCQSFSDVVPTNGYVHLHGGCLYCEISRLDIEYHGSGGPLGVGLQISGNGHRVQVNAFNLAQAIKSSTGIGCEYGPQKFSSCAAGLLLDSGSDGNRIIDTGFQITNQGTGNYRIGGGGTRSGIATKTGTYQILATDSVVECNASGGAFTATLPTPSSVNAGTHYWVKKVDSSGNAVTVGGTIDGATNYSLAAQYKFVHVAVNAAGTAYHILGAN